jgi:glycosyltransferase involved in cell wall biosynthesis
MSTIRVAHVITRLCKGGAQENTFHTHRLANRDRYTVDLISGPMSGHEGSLEPAITDAGFSILREPSIVRRVSLWNDARAVRNLTKLFREKGYHIVHTHTSKAGFVGRLAATRAGIPAIVHTPHGNVFHGYFGPWPTRIFVELERRATRWCDCIIELTNLGVEENLEHGIGVRSQHRVIFSGVDLAPYDEALRTRESTRGALGVESDTVLIGGVGRLEPIKGFTYFIRAAQAIGQAIPDAQFILAGQGSLEEPLRREAGALGKRFRFLGHRYDIPGLMAAIDLLVVPSVNEGMGRVVLEAGAAKTPVIASRVGGLPEVVLHGETGLLVAPKDSEALVQAVVALAEDPDRRKTMGEAAQSHVVPKYGLENMVSQIESLYEELLREKGIDA